MRIRCRYSVVTKDVLYHLLSFFFLLIPLSHRNLRSLLLPGNYGDRSQTLTQCAECSQFIVDRFFGNLTYFTGVLGHQTFRATATIRYSSKLFISVSIYDVTANIFAILQTLICCFFEAEIPTSLMQT